MQKAGEDFAILGDGEKCCGLYAFDLGFRREYERLKDDNLATLTHAGVKKVHRRLRQLPTHLARVRQRSERASKSFMASSSSIRRSNLGGCNSPSRSLRKLPITIPVTSAAAAVFTIRRGNIFRAIPGLQLVEMERNRRWAWCCGGGGGVPEADPDLAQWNAADRMREARATGAELVLTSSALCQRSFGDLQPMPGCRPQDLLEFALQAL